MEQEKQWVGAVEILKSNGNGQRRWGFVRKNWNSNRVLKVGREIKHPALVFTLR